VTSGSGQCKEGLRPSGKRRELLNQTRDRARRVSKDEEMKVKRGEAKERTDRRTYWNALEAMGKTRGGGTSKMGAPGARVRRFK